MAKIKTMQTKLAEKFNRRIRDYNKLFGEGYAKYIYKDVKDIVLTKKGISAKSFTGPEAKDVVKDLNTKLQSPRKMIREMAKELGIKNPYTKENLAKIVSNIIAKDEVEERFDAAKEEFYLYDATGLDLTGMTEYNEVSDILFHEGKWESYTEMLNAINRLEEFLKKWR